MGLFNKNGESKEDKKARKEAELLAKFGLEDLTGKDLESVKTIISELAGNKFLESGALLSGAKSEDLVKISNLTAIVEQNWIIIRLLSQINKKLDK